MHRVLPGVLAAVICTGCSLFAPPPQTAMLSGGDVMLTAPAGYCVDRFASRPGQGFALIAPCASLGGKSAAPAVVGIVTLQVGPKGSAALAGAERGLRDFLMTAEGAALLSTTGDATGPKVVASQAFDGRVMIYYTDVAAAPLAGLQPAEWRGFVEINGRLVTVALRGLASDPLEDGPGAALLQDMLAGLSGPRASAAAAPLLRTQDSSQPQAARRRG